MQQRLEELQEDPDGIYGDMTEQAMLDFLGIAEGWDERESILQQLENGPDDDMSDTRLYVREVTLP